MKLLQFNKRHDFGHDWYVQIVNIGRNFPKFLKHKSLIQISITWDDCPSWPYFQMSSGSGVLFSFVIWLYRFGFSIDIMGRTWTWDHLKNIDFGHDDA